MGPEVEAPADRKYSCWLGAAILSLIEKFEPMWITKKEYEENGLNRISGHLILSSLILIVLSPGSVYSLSIPDYSYACLSSASKSYATIHNFSFMSLT